MSEGHSAETDVRHLWGSVTKTLCGLDAFKVVGTHVLMTSGPILRVAETPEEATCRACLTRVTPHGSPDEK